MVASPLTGSSETSLLKRYSTDKLVEDWKTTFQIDISEEIHNHSEICLYECNQTKLRFFSPSDVAGSGKLYEQLQQFDWFYMPHKWEHGVALGDLKDCKQVLEVGSAFGDFIESGIKSGLNIQGLELNEAAVTVCQEKKLPVSRVDLEDFANQYPESQDAICSFQVLEHIPDPKSFIDASLKALKSNGQLIFCVPNVESFLGHQYNLLDMPPHHMLQWSEDAFKALEKIFPLKLEKVIREPLETYHVSAYIHAYGRYFNSITPLSRILFNRLTIPVYERLLHFGLRKKLTGQSLYVQFRKVS
jgi:2-polyprenyl-3-methyl-5-hydroxy-6-metoxy-1,4-benzoquinol methylase